MASYAEEYRWSVEIGLQRKQPEASIPRLEAEPDIPKVNSPSAEETAAQAAKLYQHWQDGARSEARTG